MSAVAVSVDEPWAPVEASSGLGIREMTYKRDGHLVTQPLQDCATAGLPLQKALWASE
ncbi:hypothetical protein DFO47_11420 [Arthrobacter sp. AG258]|nr:hypothetical protein DFO47_11420 [Arthrobacter sp. AG258]